MAITGATGNVVAGGSARIFTATVREQIITGFETMMMVIKTSNGYHSDAGNNVFRCRRNLDPSELPCIVLWPGMEIAERADYGETFYSMKMGVEYHDLLRGENASVLIERMLGDLIQSVFSMPILHVDSVMYESGGPDTYPDVGDVAAACKINLNIKYNYLHGNPYSPSGG